jgi:sensor domain CHASE-containing protein
MVGVSSHGLTEKTLLDLSIALVIIIIVIILFSSSILLTSYENLESDRVRGDVQLIKNNLKVALGGLKSLAIDVGAWDDSYTFALGKNPSFISKNYGKETFVKQNINIVIFTSARGDILYAQGYDNDSNELVPVPRRVLDEAGSVNSPLRNLTPEGSALGLFSTDDSVLLITSYPIVHTDFSGPAAGTVIIGKGIYKNEIKQLTSSIVPSLSLVPLDSPTLSLEPEDRALFSQMGNEDDLAAVVENKIYGLEGCAYARVVRNFPVLVWPGCW